MSESELSLWARSGAMALTGRADGPPLASPGRPATTTAQALEQVATLTERRTGKRPRLPDIRLLGERAAISGLSRQGPRSCGGAFRTIPTADGWMGLTLARPTDFELVPALVEDDSASGWEPVVAWASTRPTREAADRAALLGLACAAQRPSIRPGVICAPGGARLLPERPVVLDLTSLWAGPLCAHLLGLSGTHVIKVESTTRPDGARFGPTEFFDLLHHGHEMVSLDFGDRSGLRELQRLARSADLVLEASRPRALSRLGLVAEELVDQGTSWLSITAAGRASDAVGFGDDVAVGAGLNVQDSGEVLPCGDALADPLAGVAAAAAAAAALDGDRAVLLDLSMHDVAAEAAFGPTEPHQVRLDDAGQWWVETDQDRFRVCAASRSPR